MKQNELENSFQKGILIDSRFLVTNIVPAHRGMVVIRAQDTTLDNIPILLKMFHTDENLSKKQLENFKSELIATRQLSHPGIEAIYDIVTLNNQFIYTCAQDINGTFLSALLNADKDKQISFNFALTFLYQMTQSLKVAHDMGVLHRLINPENIVVRVSECDNELDHRGIDDREIELEQAHFINFGLEQLGGSDFRNLSEEDIFDENFIYMPPEQLEDKDIDETSDLYSLGMVTLSILLGRLLDDPVVLEQSPEIVISSSIAEIRSRHKNIPDWFFECIQRLCSIDMAQRFKNAEEVQLFIVKSIGSKSNRQRPRSDKRHSPSILKPQKGATRSGTDSNKKYIIFAGIITSLVLMAFVKVIVFPNAFSGSFSSNSTNSESQNELFQALRTGKDAEVFSLLKKGLSPNIKDDTGTPLIVLAVELGHIDIAYTLLSNSPQIIDMQDKTGMTALHVAVKKNLVDFVSLLNQFKANKDLPDKKGSTARDLAVAMGNSEIVELFK